MKKNILIVGIALVAMMSSVPLRAQILSAGDLFGPGAPPPMIGIELGFGSHQQLGTFQANCGCTFPANSGVGFLAGLLFELPVNYELTFGLGVKFDFKGYTTTTNVVDQVTIHYQPGDSVASGDFSFQRKGVIKETFLTLAPFVRYEFFRNGLFVQAGPGVGFLLSSHFTHTRVLTSSTIPLSNGQTLTNVRFEDGTKEQTLEDGPISPVITSRISALITAGWNIVIGDKAVLAPMITYDLPFTKVRDNALAQDWKISSLFFTAGLKYKLD